jgi:hypothetical protein
MRIPDKFCGIDLMRFQERSVSEEDRAEHDAWPFKPRTGETPTDQPNEREQMTSTKTANGVLARYGRLAGAGKHGLLRRMCTRGPSRRDPASLSRKPELCLFCL